MHARPRRSPNGRVREVRHHGLADWIPPIQLAPTGQPISIADSVVSAVVLSLALALLAKLVGPSIFL